MHPFPSLPTALLGGPVVILISGFLQLHLVELGTALHASPVGLKVRTCHYLKMNLSLACETLLQIVQFQECQDLGKVTEKSKIVRHNIDGAP